MRTPRIITTKYLPRGVVNTSLLLLALEAAACVSRSTYDAKVAELERARTALENANLAHSKQSSVASKLRERLAAAKSLLRKSDADESLLAAQLEGQSRENAELKEAFAQREAYIAGLEQQLRNDEALLVEFQTLADSYGAATPEELSRMIAALKARVSATERQLQSAADELERERRISSKLKSLIDAGKLRVRHRSGRLVIELPGDIHFASGSAALTDDGKTTLAQLAPVLQAEGDRLFVVEGHTDNVPIKVSGFRSNWHLGSTRAEASRDALVSGGLDPAHVAIATWADLLPACSDVDDDACRKRNRRVEVLVLPRFE